MNSARLPNDRDAWTTVDARLDGAPPSHIVCDTCSEWVHVRDLDPDVCPNTCPDCLRRMDDELTAFLDAHPFPPTPATAVDLASLSVDGAGAGVGSSPAGPTLSDRITRDVVRLLSHPLTSAAARVAVVGVSVVGWSYFFAVAVLP